MNKIGLILAGALVFDLGVVVTSSHAAYDAFLKLDATQPHPALKIKLTTVQDPSLCTAHGGTVSGGAGDQYCLLPAVDQAHTTAPATHMGY
jgi:hypothetical protein